MYTDTDQQLLAVDKLELGRIGGPQHHQRCTRVATILKLRRSKESTIQLYLQGKDNYYEEFQKGNEEISIKSAQDKALQLAGLGDNEAGFVEDYEIHIHVTNENLPNVTLIDLPGLLTDDGETNQHDIVHCSTISHEKSEYEWKLDEHAIIYIL
jgi:hypothetical protein